MEPLSLGLALAARKEELRDVKIFILGPGRIFDWYETGWEESFSIEISYVVPVIRKMFTEKRCDYLVSSLFCTHPPETRGIDVLCTEVSPPNENGFCSFGAMLWDKKAQIKGSKTVIADVNPNLIRTYGENYVHVSEIDYFVEHIASGKIPGKRGSLGRKSLEVGKDIKSIARNVSTLIRNGDTIEIGVGAGTEYLAGLGIFDDKKDLGWHSEQTSRGIIKLVREGVFTGKHKTLHRGKVVATAFVGSPKEDMDFVNENPLFELYPGEHILDPRVIAAHDNMVAINSILSIDLTGQISAESIGPRMISGTGGLLAFALGATLSKGGRFIVVLPSTAKNGTVSRIVPMLEQGTTVSVPRVLTDYVITEYGMVRLKGKTQRERAFELISIAHPDFRPELEKEAKRLYWP
jgi:4-hydroxybutyrate CoA-transferase